MKFHAAMISTREKTLTDRAEELFDGPRGRPGKSDEALTARLYQQIGELQTELSWLKQVGDVRLPERNAWIDQGSNLSSRQCSIVSG